MIAQEKDQRLLDIGQRLRDFRKQQGYKSQEAFAVDVGSTRAAIAAYEIGKVEPTGAFLHNLSTKFGADINYILTGKSEQEMPDFDTYLTRMGVDDMMKTIIKGYMALPPDKRKTVKEYIESLAAEIAAKKTAAEPPADAAQAADDAPPLAVESVPPVSKSDTAADEPTPENLTEDEKEILRQLRLEKSMQTTTASRYISSG